MSFKDRLKSTATTLRLDSHHAIERFGIAFTLVVALGLSLVVSGLFSAAASRSELASNTALYTTSFTTSKTQLSGDVSGIYTNTAGTRAMVLMRFNNPASVSSDAKNYQAFLTGSAVGGDIETLATVPTGKIVVFGFTGYMAVVLDSPTPFELQILNLTLRANSELVYTPDQARNVRKELSDQQTFINYDQWRVYFNPGASGAIVNTALDGEDFDPGAVYADLVVAPQEKTLRTTMDDQLGQMQADLTSIAEYTAEINRTKIDGVGLVAPKVPEQIAGDEVVGTPKVGETPSTLALVTDWVSPAGFDFDWRGGSVSEGYIDSIVPTGESYVAFLSAKASASKNGDSGAFRMNPEDWVLTDGKLLSDFNQSTDKAMKPLFDIRNNLSQAYQSYYTHKLAYQVNSLTDLINLEVDLRNVRSGASIHSDGENSLFTY